MSSSTRAPPPTATVVTYPKPTDHRKHHWVVRCPNSQCRHERPVSYKLPDHWPYYPADNIDTKNCNGCYRPYTIALEAEV